MKLTKRKALELTVELWDWLTNNPEKKKTDWPGWELNGGKIPKLLNDCPCCEYDDQHMTHFDDYCEHCPLLEYWPGGNCEPDSRVSPWQDWIDVTDGELLIDEAKEAATEIADLARQALADHNKRYPIQK